MCVNVSMIIDLSRVARGREVLVDPLVVLHHVNLERTPLGHELPNSEAGRAALKNSAPFAPARVCARSCAGITPSEKPA